MKKNLTVGGKNLRTIKKVLLIMKLTFLLILVGLLQVSANVNGQDKISLKLDKAEISKVLNTIETQGTFRFLYNSRLQSIRQKIDVDVKQMDIKELLAKMFSGTDLTYKLLENNLIVVLSNSVALQDIKITGKITGDNGEALSGVSVTLKGTSRGTTTDNSGNFTLTVPENGALVISYIGYQGQEIAISSQPVINIKLVSSNKVMDQVVVIGYGVQKKRDLTGSIAVVKGDDVAKMPSTNPVASLQGMVAGLTIVNSGQPGAAPAVRIRGVNSTNNTDPLYVVDGLQQTNIDYLNQADIESMEILKDPSSTAIYGLQGGNGVIIITTKRAKNGKTTINFTSNVGIQQVSNKIKVVDATGFKKLYSDQLTNIGAAPFDFTNYTANTNWQNQILRTAMLNNNSLSVSSNTEKSTTYLNLGYSDQQGVERYGDYKKYIVRLNEEIRVTKNIRIGGDITGFSYKENPPIGGIENEALWAAPIAPIKASPGYYYAMPSFQRAQVANPVAAIDIANGHSINTGYRVTGNIFAEIKFAKYFTWKSTVFSDLSFNETRGYGPLPFHFINLGEGGSPTDTSFNNLQHTSVSQSFTQYKTFQQDHLLTFDKNFAGGHHLTVLAGFSTLYHYNDNITGDRTDTTLNIPNNSNYWYLGVAQQSNPGNYNGVAGEDASQSYLARANYTFKDRYLLNVTYRRDGTSKFSPSHEWGNFGSIGAGWVVSDESFMQNVKAIDFLKLKASWGKLGNGLNIGNYLSYPGLNNSGVGVFGNNVYPSISPAYLADPNLHWEVVEGTDAGFDLRAMNNKLNLGVDLYDRKTHDILTSVTLPGVTLPYFTNLGTIDNKGIEVTAGWTDNLSKDFKLSVNGNFSVDANKVVSIGNAFNFNIFPNGVNMTQSGHSIGYFYGYKQTGIFQTTAELDKTPHQSTSQPGDISYADINKDGKIDANDRTYLGTPFPKYNFGLSISLSYKSLDLNISGQGVGGNKVYVARRNATFATLNYETNRLSAWTGPGTTNIEPILDNTRTNNYLFSSYFLEPGDYFRLRTIQIGYTFNRSFLKNSGIRDLRLYISGQNLATFTKTTGYSPEAPISNITEAGIDNGIYPVPAIYTFGLNLTF